MGPVHYCCTSTQQFLLRGTEISPTDNCHPYHFTEICIPLQNTSKGLETEPKTEIETKNFRKVPQNWPKAVFKGVG